MPPLLLLPAERRHVVLVLAALVLVHSAPRVILDGCENHSCGGAGIADSGAVHFPAAKPLVWCDNFAVVPVGPSAVLPLLLLSAEHKRAALVPAVWALVCFAVCAFPHGYENRLRAGAGIVDSGAVNLPAAGPLVRHDNSAAVPV